MFMSLLKKVFGRNVRSKPAHKPRSFVPRLEALDKRIVPVVFRDVLSPSLLHVAGTANGDRITIADNGTGTITVNDNGVSSSVSGISSIVVNTNEGDDVVKYNLHPTVAIPVTRTITVSLGAGNDHFDASLDSLGPMRGLNLRVNGDVGNDSISVLTSTHFAIPAGVTLDVKLQGDNSQKQEASVVNLNDNLFFQYIGTIDGTLLLDLNGNVGNDTVIARVVPTGGAGQIGTSTSPAVVRGGLGTDTLDFEIYTGSTAFGLTTLGPGTDPSVNVELFFGSSAFASRTTAQIQGGDGFDSATALSGSPVTVAADVEQVTLI